MILLTNANAKHIPLADDSVNCVVTSPPYYGLRDYGTAEWVGGDHECDHINGTLQSDKSTLHPGTAHNDKRNFDGMPYHDACGKCGAIRVDKQIGLEQSPDEYVEAMCQVFDEIWRVLRDDGTVWLNLGDSYAGGGGASGHTAETTNCGRRTSTYGAIATGGKTYGLKPKDLIGIPWRVAFALQARDWYLRQDIIWHKPNPMPESVKDRCTKAHEYIFLLTKNARYWYDYEAIKEPQQETSRERLLRGWNGNGDRGYPDGPQNHLRNYMGSFDSIDETPSGRNKRSVWTVTTKPYPGSHYAVFPPDLIEPCVLAGCPETVCAKCGAPYERVVERKDRPYVAPSELDRYGTGDAGVHRNIGGQYTKWLAENPDIDKGFQPTCTCDAGTKAGVVLDPFVGSGTTCMVARKHRRNAIGLDLNFEYLNINARERLQYGGYVPVADGITQLTLEA